MTFVGLNCYIIMKINNGPKVFQMIHDNTPPSFLHLLKCFQFTIEIMQLM